MPNSHKWCYRVMGAIHLALSAALASQGQIVECAGALSLGLVHLTMSWGGHGKA